MNNWTIEQRQGCYAILDGKRQEVVFVDDSPRSYAGKPCGSVTSQGRTADELRSIALLIHAAPDLLAACKAVLAWASTPAEHGGNPYLKPFVIAARDALRKAGETVD